jgi:Protein of unknown function (DUF2281)
MTKILSRKIDALSPDQQAEVLSYVEFLLNDGKKKRMTLDNRQSPTAIQATNFKQVVEEQLSLIGYRIW